MYIPEYVEEILGSLKTELGNFLRARSIFPDDINEIPSPDTFKKGSSDRDICLAQHIYALIACIVSEVFPAAKNDSKFKLVRYVAKAKGYLDALTVDGKWSYYAASIVAEKLLLLQEKSNECDLVLMSELPEDQIPIKGKMYLEKQGNKLGYIVLTPDNKVVKDILDFDVGEILDLATLADLKSGILQETSKRGHAQSNQPETSENDVSGWFGLFETINLTPDSILTEKISLIQHYVYSSNDNAYHAAETLCQNFKNIEKTINKCCSQINEKIENPLIKTYQTNPHDIEERRTDNLALTGQLSREFVQIEQELIKTKEALALIMPGLIELPPKLLKVKEKLEEYDLQDAPSSNDIAKLQQQCDSISQHITTAKTKLTALAKQIKNEIYFNQVFTAIEQQVIIPIKGKLTSLPDKYNFESMPEQGESHQDIICAQPIYEAPKYDSYSIEIYAELLADLTALETINFEKLANDPPHPEDNSKVGKIFVDELNQAIDPLKKLLLERKQQQEQLLYQTLATVLEQQQSIFEAKCAQTLTELEPRLQRDLSNANEDTLAAEELFYNQQEEQLKQQLQLEQYIYQWVTKQNLSEHQPTQKLIQHFLKKEEKYQTFIAAFNRLAIPLEQAIKQGQVKIEMASTAKIKQLEQKAEQLTNQMIPHYEETLAQIKNTSDQQQIEYQNKKSELDQLTENASQKLKQVKALIAELTTQKTETAQAEELTSVAIPSQTNNEKTTGLEDVKQSLNLMWKEAEVEITHTLKSFENEKFSLEERCFANEKHLARIEDAKQSLAKLKNSVDTAFEQEKNISWAQKITNRGESFDAIIQQLETSISTAKKKKLVEKEEIVIEFLKKRQGLRSIIQDEEQAQKDCQALFDNWLTEKNTVITGINKKIKLKKKFILKKSKSIKTLQEKRQKLAELKDELNCALIRGQETAENTLKQLAEQQAKALELMCSSLADYLPENAQIAVDTLYQTHCQQLASMRIASAILNSKLALIKLKQETYMQRNELKKSAEDVEKIIIKSASQQTANELNNTSTTLTQLQATLDETKKSIDTLTKELASVLIANDQAWGAAEISSTQQKEILALTTLKETIGADLKLLEQQNTRLIEQLRKKKNQLLFETDIFNRETEKKQKHQGILTRVNNCITEIQTWGNRLDQHQYDEILTHQITHGEAINFIEAESDFYFDTANKLAKWRTTIDQLNQPFIQAETASGLDKAFNDTLCEKIDQLKDRLVNITRKNNECRMAWQTFTQTHQVIQNSRQVIADTKKNIGGYYPNYDLRGIQLADRDFKNVSLQGARFDYAQLTNCDFSYRSLKNVNFSHAKVSTCNFRDANFQGVILDEQTEIDWQTYGYAMLHDNLANPYINTAQEAYLTELIRLVNQKCHGISARWALTLLQIIHTAEKPHSCSEKAHWQAQQQRALFLMQQIVPKLGFKALLELGHQLVITKHAGDNNPYGFIRREFDCFHRVFIPYGNNEAWDEMITLIKTRLNTLAEGRITGNQKIPFKEYDPLMEIMNTKASRTYGFGKLSFFFTPELATKWAEKRDELVQVENPEPGKLRVL